MLQERIYKVEMKLFSLITWKLFLITVLPFEQGM